jgi:hypothetical protein
MTCRSALGYFRLGRRGPQPVGVGRERRVEGRCVPAGQGLIGPIGRGPPFGVESAGAESGQGGEHLVAHRGGEHAEHRRVGEGGVGEVGGAKVGPEPAEVGPHQGQVVVLDEDPAPRGRHFGHPLGEQLVEFAVRVPGVEPPLVGPGPPGGVEQVVVAEPQHGVGHHVVGQVVDLGLGLHQLDVDALVGHHACRCRGPVGLAHGRGHPRGPRPHHQGAHGSGQATAGCSGHRHPVLQVEGQGSPVGHEDGVGQRAILPAGGALLGHAGTLAPEGS